jgi:hypothetical protein
MKKVLQTTSKIRKISSAHSLEIALTTSMCPQCVKKMYFAVFPVNAARGLYDVLVEWKNAYGFVAA